MSFGSWLAYVFAAARPLLGSGRLIRAAGYIVMLEEVGPNVVATGSGALNVTGLTFFGTSISGSALNPTFSDIELGAAHTFPPTGPFNVDAYSPVVMTGPNFFGTGVDIGASSGTGLQVGIGVGGNAATADILVPIGYVSGTFMMSSATFDNQSFASFGVTQGTYIWTWGDGPNQAFTLIVSRAGLPGLILRLLAWWRRIAPAIWRH
jgi:hypothetical protein